MKFAQRNLSYFISISVCILLTFSAVQSKVKTPVDLKNQIGLTDFFIDKFDVYLFDADGVLWAGEHAVKGAPEFFNLLIYSGKSVFVISNGVQSIDDFKKRLEQHGFKTNLIKDIITPGIVLAENLTKAGLSRFKDEANKARTPHQDEKIQHKVFLVGNESLRKELDKKAGISVIGIPKPKLKANGEYEDPEAHPKGEYHAEVHPIEMDGKPVDPEQVDVMVVAMDVDFDLHEAKKALSYLQTNTAMKVYVLLEEHKGTGNGVYPGVKSILALLQRTLPDDERFTIADNKFETKEKLIQAINKLTKKKVYLIGDDKLDETLRKTDGVTVVTGPKSSSADYYKEVELEEDANKVAQVVFSLDFAFTMWKARKVLTYIKRNENIKVCATNEDHQLPATKGGEGNLVKSAIFPDVGGILAFVRAAMPGIEKVQKMTVLGKPHPTMFEYLLSKPEHKTAIQEGKSIFFGDSLDTDMPFANNYKEAERKAAEEKRKAAAGKNRLPIKAFPLEGHEYPDGTVITQQIMSLFVSESGKHHIIPDLNDERKKENDPKVPTFVTPSLGHLLNTRDIKILKGYIGSDRLVDGIIYSYEIPPRSEPKVDYQIPEHERAAMANTMAAAEDERKKNEAIVRKHQPAKTPVDMPKGAPQVSTIRKRFGQQATKSDGTQPQKPKVVTGAQEDVVKNTTAGLGNKGVDVNGKGRGSA